MKAVIIFATLLALVSTQADIFANFQKFMNNRTKTYQTIEELTKGFSAYTKNKAKINQLNQDTQKAKIPAEDMATFGETKFADVPADEFAATYLTLNVTDVKLSTKAIEKRLNITSLIDQLQSELASNIYDNPDAQSVPFMSMTPSTPAKNLGRNLQTGATVFNWATKGAVSAIRNQGSCGSCWSFSSVSNIESMYYMKYKKLLSLSEQQLIDCDNTDQACNGGTTGNAFTYVTQNGLSLAYGQPNGYPTGYMLAKKTCSYSSTMAAARVNGFYYFSPSVYSEDDLKNYLTTYGPLSVAINANTLQYYTGGIWLADATQCDPTTLNHAVNLVGYGTSAYGTPYWILRNHWGTSWGESGYFRFYRGSNVCGITGYVTQAIIV
jgi:C1A family cysteine protease